MTVGRRGGGRLVGGGCCVIQRLQRSKIWSGGGEAARGSKAVESWITRSVAQGSGVAALCFRMEMRCRAAHTGPSLKEFSACQDRDQPGLRRAFFEISILPPHIVRSSFVFHLLLLLLSSTGRLFTLTLYRKGDRFSTRSTGVGLTLFTHRSRFLIL